MVLEEETIFTSDLTAFALLVVCAIVPDGIIIYFHFFRVSSSLCRNSACSHIFHPFMRLYKYLLPLINHNTNFHEIISAMLAV
jgi:hypothetical protein